MTLKNIHVSMLICIVSSLFVVLKMYTGSNLFLIVFMLLIMTAMLLDKQPHRVEYLLFFISWVYVIKFDLTSYSLFVVLSFVYIVVSIMTLIMLNKSISTRLVFAYMLFGCFAIGATLFNGGNLIEVLGFVLNYSVLFFAVLFIDSNTYFKRYTYIYATGLLSAAIVRWISFSVQEIDSFIQSMTIVNTVKTTSALNTRFTGLDLDPNYFSLQILIAITCLLVLCYYDSKKNIKPIVFIIVLAIFGIFTYSKMFIITFTAFILLTFFMFVKNNVKTAVKFASFIIMICGVMLLFFYEKLFEIYKFRFFGAGTSTDAITTGRLSRWNMFAAEIFQSTKIFIMGAGFGTSFSHEKMAHTMYLSTLYYLGIIGIVLVLLYISSLNQVLRQNIGISRETTFQLFSINAIPLYIMLIANIVLDSFIMDFFPFHIMLIMFALTFQKNQESMAGR
ncbi:O-antigen ligase family protein [Lysinibacillus sp. NPDC097195]|uniref:O-antigen ligase family protein n=1 Tax=Lysinibacillus sp. NPDC097195 TaxID=3364141 RepID=UPI00380ADD4C